MAPLFEGLYSTQIAEEREDLVARFRQGLPVPEKERVHWHIDLWRRGSIKRDMYKCLFKDARSRCS